MTGGGVSDEIPRYVERVRATLADLPPEVRDELTEDLAEHLAEVAAEADGTLADRLGTPETYAAELRAAAGAGEPVGARNLDQRVATAMVKLRARLRTVDRRLGPTIGYPTASEYLRLLRPAWWLFRGYLVAMLLTVVLGGGPLGLLPLLGDSTLGGLLLLGLCVAASVWLGRRTPGLPRWPRRALGVGTALLVLFGLVVFVEAAQRGGRPAPSYREISTIDPYGKVRDVFVYDSQGRLVEGARLFDQDGEPIRFGDPYPYCPGSPEPDSNRAPHVYPYCPSAAPFQFQPPATSVPGQSPPGQSSAPNPTPTVAPTATVPPATATPGAPATVGPTR